MTRTRAAAGHAEVVGQDLVDADSEPADADPAEDDLVELRPLRRQAPRRLSLTFLVGPASGGRARLDLSGRLVLPPRMPLEEACQGSVTVEHRAWTAGRRRRPPSRSSSTATRLRLRPLGRRAPSPADRHVAAGPLTGNGFLLGASSSRALVTVPWATRGPEP